MSMDKVTLGPTRTRISADALFSRDRLGSGRKLGSIPGRGVRFGIKRALDYGCAAVAMVLLGPFMLGIALAIRLDSKGAAFFRQRRLGRNGKPFWIWKFRTMVVDAEARLAELEALNESEGGVLFKIRRDPRVTRVGHILRRTSLDELPQLINVLLGQMSLVGPRPLPIRDCERLREADEARYMIRQRVLPGLTGPWQLGGRSEVGFDEMLGIDVEYVTNWKLSRDLTFLARTAIVPVTGRGAY